MAQWAWPNSSRVHWVLAEAGTQHWLPSAHRVNPPRLEPQKHRALAWMQMSPHL